MIRVAKEAHIPYIFLENVAALLSKPMRAVFQEVATTLVEAGYNARWTILTAGEVGAPMYGARFFLLARHHSVGDCVLRRIVEPLSERDWHAEVAHRTINHEGCASFVMHCMCLHASRTFPQVATKWDHSCNPPPPMEDWLLPKRCPDLHNRLAMMGNCVMPAMARTAFRLLIHA